MLKVFAREELGLTEGELQLRRKKQRRIVIASVAILILLGIGYLSARPALNAVRAWQARRHAQKAFGLIDQQKWDDARNEAITAYHLRATEPEAIRAVARLLSRAGQSDALKFWKELEAKDRLTRTDLRDEAGVALQVRELDVADRTIKELLTNREGGPAPPDWLLAADLAMQEQDPEGATIQVRNIFASSIASARDLFKATLILDRVLQSKQIEDRSEVLERLARLAGGKESVALDALVMLAQNFLASKAPWPSPAGMSAEKIVEALETHPLAKTQHKILAIDLKIREHPDQREDLVQATIAQWKGGDNASLLALASWLNTRGEYQRELDTIPRERAVQTRELLFQHVDALGALGRWDEIRRLIENEQFPLDPVVAHMYLARCFAQQGQTNGAENNWSRALQAAAGDLAKLMILGDYAEKNGTYDVAAAAYEAAVAAAPRSRPAQQGRLRLAYQARDTKKIHAILVELLKLWPNDPAVQNDEAYARLLLLPSINNSQSPTPSVEITTSGPPKDGLDVAGSQLSAPKTPEVPPSPSFGAASSGQRSEVSASATKDQEQITINEELRSIEHLGEKLVAREPASLPHRTVLALARLKQNRPADALSIYREINVPSSALTTSSLAVHAAVLAAAGHMEEARAEFARLPADKLLPEEKALIQSDEW
jgi:tetratricopeptide (TPR) repeat protein